MRHSAIKSARIEYKRLAHSFLCRDMCMAVAHQVIFATSTRLAEKAAVVAVNEGDSSVAERKIAKQAVADQAGLLDRGPQLVVIVVAIAKDEVRRPGGQQLGNLRRADVAAVQYH